MWRKLLICVFGASFLYVAHALRIEIKKGNIKPDPIALVSPCDKDGNPSEDGDGIFKIVGDDLTSSGLFKIIDHKLYLESPELLARKRPNPKNWSIIGARFLVHGSIEAGNFGKLTVSFKVMDVMAQQDMLSLEVKGSRANLREMAHVVADHIYKRITNEAGHFNTRIAYIETVGTARSEDRTTRAVEIDQDGYGRFVLTDGDNVVITPRFTPTGDGIAYLWLPNTGERTYPHVSIVTRRSRANAPLIGPSVLKKLNKAHSGKTIQMTYAPRFSPDNTTAVLAIIIDGKSAIFKLDLTTHELTQLTPFEKIDTSPCFTADGKHIIFTSDRAGKEAIYKMSADGDNPVKISKGSGKYSQPMVSPRGDLIAFSYQKGGRFYIGTMRLDGSAENMIFSSYLVEAPCWAPNGRYIAASMTPSAGAKSRIVVVDITGNHVRMIPTQGDAQYPAWGPLREYP
ncbi:MAG: Tol-Pal system protein TolB [Holosporales bacterium]|jgi:TolB protein|nr:Tol-Pal system protein TolB [Holosporales bacterium]